jgi:Spx/MgsR family transcriptional regulator
MTLVALSQRRQWAGFMPAFFSRTISNMIILYGIANCDSVKKARAWLTTHNVAHSFHDFKKSGVPTDALATWVHAVGRDKLLNRQGTTWRKLGAATQARVVDDASAMALMQALPSLIKRPVVCWAGGITVGFDADTWTRHLPGPGV